MDRVALGRVPNVCVRGGRQDTASAPREEQASGHAAATRATNSTRALSGLQKSPVLARIAPI